MCKLLCIHQCARFTDGLSILKILYIFYLFGLAIYVMKSDQYNGETMDLKDLLGEESVAYQQLMTVNSGLKRKQDDGICGNKNYNRDHPCHPRLWQVLQCR